MVPMARLRQAFLLLVWHPQPRQAALRQVRSTILGSKIVTSMTGSLCLIFPAWYPSPRLRALRPWLAAAPPSQRQPLSRPKNRMKIDGATVTQALQYLGRCLTAAGRQATGIELGLPPPASWCGLVSLNWRMTAGELAHHAHGACTPVVCKRMMGDGTI